ncbi:hypothetical protein DENSPDRAFT_841765 [Dentipellis sp. KUC8613]|nr:hypothetical protein DENSPDRAFT_841765 [Dentipellis sp. KUC8613]
MSPGNGEPVPVPVGSSNVPLTLMQAASLMATRAARSHHGYCHWCLAIASPGMVRGARCGAHGT